MFFNKLEAIPNEANSIFKHTIRRLLIFFAIWYILMLPYSIPNFFMKATFKELLFVIPFGLVFSYNYIFQNNEIFSNSIIKYIVVVLLVTMISFTILKLEKKEYLSYLKCLH